MDAWISTGVILFLASFEVLKTVHIFHFLRGQGGGPFCFFWSFTFTTFHPSNQEKEWFLRLL